MKRDLETWTYPLGNGAEQQMWRGYWRADITGEVLYETEPMETRAAVLDDLRRAAERMGAPLRAGRPPKAPAEKHRPWHPTFPPDVSAALEAARRPGETDSALLVRLLRMAAAREEEYDANIGHDDGAGR